MADVDSAVATQIVDSSSAELLRELNEKRQRRRLWPVVLGVSVVALLLGALTHPGAVPLLVIGGWAAVAFAHRRDALRKTVVLFYELDAEMERAYDVLHQAAGQLAACARAWHIEAEGQVLDRKYHAGADTVISRKPTSIRTAAPPYLKTNVETIAVGVGRQVLHFFPDRVLIYEARGVGAVGYRQLELTVEPTRMIEGGGVPADATVVDHTWKYVNKRGGPDRRFNNNAELPICQYDELTLRSPTGLREVVQLSRTGAAGAFAEAVRFLAERLPVETRGHAPSCDEPVTAAAAR